MRRRDAGFNFLEETAPTLDAGISHTVAFKPGQSEAAGAFMPTEEFAPTLQATNNGSTAVPAVAFTAHETGQGYWKEDDQSGPLRAEGENRPSRPSNVIGQTPAVAFKPSHFTRGKDGAPSETVPPLSADADKGDQEAVIAHGIPGNWIGRKPEHGGNSTEFMEETAPSLTTADRHGVIKLSADADKGDQDPVVFETRYARNGRGAPDDVVPPLKAQSGQTGKGDAAPVISIPKSMIVRRLTHIQDKFNDLVQVNLGLYRDIERLQARVNELEDHCGRITKTCLDLEATIERMSR